MRNELEKEVKRLQDEIQSLKNENKQLKEDKEDVERQFIDFKLKHDSIVTKLRGKTLTAEKRSDFPLFLVTLNIHRENCRVVVIATKAFLFHCERCFREDVPTKSHVHIS